MSKLFPSIIRITPFNSTQVRWLPRWSHRHPVRVIPAEEYNKNKDKQINIEKVTTVDKPKIAAKINWKQPFPNPVKVKNEENVDKPMEYKIKTDKNTSKNKNIKPLTISKSNKIVTKTVDMLETIIDKDGNFIYTKMRNNDSRITSILVEVKSKKEKDKKDLILLEGKRLIKDALQSGCKLEYILFSRINDVQYIRPFLPKLGAKLYKMPYRELQMWSDLGTNPGLMGIFRIPETDNFTTNTHNLPLTVICDNVREPNNLGSILRTCSGVGCVEVILTKGCVNVWDTKVIRSAMGAHFKLNIKRKLDWDDIREKIGSHSSIYIADNHLISTESDEATSGNNLANLLKTVPVLPYYGIDFRTNMHMVLIIGGETEGISEESYKLASELNGVRLNIPLSNNVDSLNTGIALGVITFEMKRQLARLIEDSRESICENNT